MARLRAGFWSKDERTHNVLLHDSNYTPIPEEFAVDNDLPVKFTYPWTGNRLMPGRVVIAKGKGVAFRADRNYQKDYITDKMLPCITIANGGSSTTDTKDYGGTYTRTENIPIGITLNNVYKTVDGTMEWGYPLIAREAHIRVPYFASNDSLATAFNWACAYNTLSNGSYVKFDANGNYVPWVDGVDDEVQKVGRVSSIDRNLPVDLLNRVYLDIADTMAGFGATGTSLREPLYNQNVMIPPSPFGGLETGDQTFGTRTARTDLRKPYQYTPEGVGYKDAESQYILDQSHLLQLMGIDLHNGIERGKEEVTETIAPAATTKYSYSASDSETVLTLDHGMILRDDKGVVAPNSSHPFPSKLTIANNSTPAQLLEEGVDYIVRRQKGQVKIKNTAGTETWKVIYTHVEDVVSGIPANQNYAGVVGEARIIIDTFK